MSTPHAHEKTKLQVFSRYVGLGVPHFLYPNFFSSTLFYLLISFFIPSNISHLSLFRWQQNMHMSRITGQFCVSVSQRLRGSEELCLLSCEQKPNSVLASSESKSYNQMVRIGKRKIWGAIFRIIYPCICIVSQPLFFHRNI